MRGRACSKARVQVRNNSGLAGATGHSRPELCCILGQHAGELATACVRLPLFVAPLIPSCMCAQRSGRRSLLDRADLRRWGHGVVALCSREAQERFKIWDISRLKGEAEAGRKFYIASCGHGRDGYQGERRQQGREGVTTCNPLLPFIVPRASPGTPAHRNSEISLLFIFPTDGRDLAAAPCSMPRRRDGLVQGTDALDGGRGGDRSGQLFYARGQVRAPISTEQLTP